MTENVFRDRVQMIRGIPFPDRHFFNKQNIEDALDYVPLDGDIIVASYPKTGTTWLQYIVLQIITKSELFPTFDDLIHKIAPFMEMFGIEAVKNLATKPRMYTHHFPYDKVQKNDAAKYLYVYRNPADTFISYYHFNCRILKKDIDFNEFFDNCMAGTIGYGSYFEHVLSYIAHKDDPNMLLVSYEKLQRNGKEEVLRIAKFLGKEYYDDLVKDEQLLEKVLERTSFEYIKKNLYLTRPEVKKQGKIADSDSDKIVFFRKGTIGDGKKKLSIEQRQRLKDKILQNMQGSAILEEWLRDIE